MVRFFFLIPLFFLFFGSGYADERLSFKENFSKAEPGDYLVTYCQKTYTLLLVRQHKEESIVLEEIIVPEKRAKGKNFSWKNWLNCLAPGNTSWAIYELNLNTGQMDRAFSFTKDHWFSLPQANNFLGTLLTLQFKKVGDRERKRTGIAHEGEVRNGRKLWQPKMIVEGQEVHGIPFDAWTTIWPRDGSNLSGKKVEIYVPQERERYPTYFPYWLQVSGGIGQAVIQIVDSGKALQSGKPLPQLIH